MSAPKPAEPSGLGPRIRPRRLRATPALRRLVGETDVAARHLVLPVFVREGLSAPQPISSMPGVEQVLEGVHDDVALPRQERLTHSGHEHARAADPIELAKRRVLSSKLIIPGGVSWKDKLHQVERIETEEGNERGE